MIKEITRKWENNKHKLEQYFRETNQSEYDSYEIIVKRLFELVINGYAFSYDCHALRTIDDGDMTGTIIFILPEDVYTPGIEKYVMTYTYYCACSDCLGMRNISGKDTGLPSKKQVEGYMTIASHLVQKMKKISD